MLGSSCPLNQLVKPATQRCQHGSLHLNNRVRPKTVSIGLSTKPASELTWSWLLEKPWLRKSNGKQSINANAQSSPKRSYIRLSWQSKTTVLIMNKCTCQYNNTNDFLKLSTTTCMSMRPSAEINLDDAHLSDFCMSCAQQPVLTNHSRK